jgi:5-amino-6-(5-phospho-D-ribitylamino)uracil phosphatase
MAQHTLYISDLDGTLLDRQGQLSPTTRRTLETLLAQGILFTIATSRSAGSVRTLLGDLPLTLPVIEGNGAFISNLATGQHLWMNPLDPALVEPVLATIAQHHCTPLIAVFDKSFQQAATPAPAILAPAIPAPAAPAPATGDAVYFAELANPGMAWYADDGNHIRQGRRWIQQSGLDATFFGQHPDLAVMRLTLIDRAPAIQSLAAQLHQILPTEINTHAFVNPYQTDWHWLTIQAATTTKGHAIRQLQTLHSLKDLSLKTCKLVVFGDEGNDIPMFAIADRAIAPTNAIPAIQAAATEIIGPHWEDSVAQYLAQNFSIDQTF